MAGKIGEVREAIYQAFATGWSSYSPFCLGNESKKPTTAALWVRCTVLHLGSEQESLGPTGNRRFQRDGLIIVQVFAPLDAGTKVSDAAVQKVRDIFEGTRIPAHDIRIHALTPHELGILEGWYQVNAELDFTYIETR
jgi:hypothetical protein